MQETYFLPKSYLPKTIVSFRNASYSGTQTPQTRTLPFYLTTMIAVSPLLIYQNLHCMWRFLYPKSRMLVTPSFLRHRMSRFVGLPC
ncbi:hypothetical protein ES332_D10G129400v1 [Gossypium tomentosum]|uniref:Uncharacterized protein n=1 Tax=Gossypium tomentosum TaxID=34277 RepID=A0A5D2J502_GOSTO|nr:hypothetical protein ES332_D10G129400v1 [Gossypium tomentosum]